jgi:hypothetical protein
MKAKRSIKAEEDKNGSTSAHENDLHFQLMMAELVDQLEEATPFQRQSASLRKMVARFGDAYFFYNPQGDFCLMTDFLRK